jgi:hypothetical protein
VGSQDWIYKQHHGTGGDSMRRLLLLLMITMLVVCSVGALSELTDYGNVTSLNINITESMGAQTDYQIKFILSNASGISGYYVPDNVIYTNGTTRPDWYDINVTDGAGTPLSFWVENNTATAYNATVWVKIPTISVDNSSVLKWRYGYSTQTESTANIYNTFRFGDDFIDSSVNTTQWDRVATSPYTETVSNSILRMQAASSAGSDILYSTNMFGPGNATTYRAQFLAGHNDGIAYGGFSNRNTTVDAARYSVRTDKTQAATDTRNNGAQTETLEGTTGEGSYVIYSIDWISNSLVNYYRSDTLIEGVTTTVPNEFNLSAQIASAYNLEASDVYFDWIVVRKIILEEPITSSYVTTEQAAIAPAASFTCTPTSTTLGTPISCTDTSSDTPTNWTYYWGDGNVTDGTQNPSYTYPFTGTFSINQTVNNTLGSSWYNRSNYITITNVSGFTQQDLWQTGHYTKTLHITDSATNAPIPVVVVTDSNGQSYTTTNGTAYFTEDAGAVVFYFAATGYVSKSMSYIIDGDSTDTVQMVTLDTNEPVYNVYPPKDVKFHITSFFGSPIQNASVQIQGITTSTGNWDWLVTLLGISLDEVAINGTAMTETTDSNGDAVFLMLPSVKYNITTVADGYTFPTTILAPQATEYTITANWNESWFSSGNDTLKDVNVSVSWVTINSTHSFVNITYDDQTATTTGGDILVYREAPNRIANATPVKIMNITSSSCSNSTIVDTPTGGASYRVLVNATTTDQNIMRTFTHYFKGAPVALPGWTSETLLWLALFCVIFTAAFAGAIHSPQMAIVLCVESWVFWAIGWLDALITQFWYGEAAILGILTLASFLAVMWNITEGKSKVKRSS